MKSWSPTLPVGKLSTAEAWLSRVGVSGERGSAERDLPAGSTELSSKTSISLAKTFAFVVVRSRWLVQSGQVVPPSLAPQERRSPVFN